MAIRILKFGGTSMADRDSWRQVLDIIRPYSQPVIVVSATALTTRALVAAAELAGEGEFEEARRIRNEIEERHKALVEGFIEQSAEYGNIEKLRQRCENWIDEQLGELDDTLNRILRQGLTPELKDRACSTGELLSSYLIAACGRSYGLSTRFVDAREIMKTNEEFGRARPDLQKIGEASERIREMLDEGLVPVMGGYVGRSTGGKVTTLGFEGSDYTAGLLGNVLRAEAVEIWTDVSGVYSIDPRYVDEASPIPQLNYQEAAELARFGAKVLHPLTVEPAATANIPVFVKNMFDPEAHGTCIDDGISNGLAVKAVAWKQDVIQVHVRADDFDHALPNEVSAILHEHHRNADLFNAAGDTVSFVLGAQDWSDELRAALDKLGHVTESERRGLVTLIGHRMRDARDLMHGVMDVLNEGDFPWYLFSYGTSNTTLSLLTNNGESAKLAGALHNRLLNVKSADHPTDSVTHTEKQ